MILITGATGFIGSVLVWKLNQLGITDIILSDKFRTGEKWKNIANNKFYDFIDRDELVFWLNSYGKDIDIILHMGACSSTMETDVDYLINNNYKFTMELWNLSIKHNIRFLYASSAATYGVGENGYNDNESEIERLRPINPYGYSKQLFDVWALKQKEKPKQWAGFKFFNVYGPNEYHKGRMASVIFHSFNQAKETRKVKLFKSYKDGFKDGEQKRDFVYVKDVVDVIAHFIENEQYNGIYNIGTGKAETFLTLATSTMQAMGIEPNIEFIEMPEYLRDKYQYFTEANIKKLRDIGYTKEFYSLKDGAFDYVKNYLMKENPYI